MTYTSRMITSHVLSFFLFLFLGACGQETESPFPSPVSGVADGCVVAGCSGQLCVDEQQADTVTTCEWKTAYACYQGATCERQDGGACGWTQTPELLACLEEAETIEESEPVL